MLDSQDGSKTISTNKVQPTEERAKAGRPTREQAEARHAELLDAALDLFLERGFEQTTMESIAAAVGMTKRTVYARYPDKAALFRATIDRAIVHYSIPRSALAAAESDDLEETLIAVAHLRLGNLMTERGQKLQRVLNAEAYRFPGIFDHFFLQAVKPSADFLADVLRRKGSEGALIAMDTDRAAVAFLSMVVGAPARGLLAGSSIAGTELDERIRFSVRLFLNGARIRTEKE